MCLTYVRHVCLILCTTPLFFFFFSGLVLAFEPDKLHVIRVILDSHASYHERSKDGYARSHTTRGNKGFTHKKNFNSNRKVVRKYQSYNRIFPKHNKNV